MQHHDDLVAATRDGELWKLWYTTVPAPETDGAPRSPAGSACSRGPMLPFAVVDPTTGARSG